MWLFTKYGFFSVVCARQGPRPDDTDPNLVMVRARDRGHLMRLRAAFGVEAAVAATPDNDYPYRLILPKSEWASILSALAEGLDYDNFKAEAERRFGGEEAYPALLHRLWGVVYDHYAGLRPPKAPKGKGKK